MLEIKRRYSIAKVLFRRSLAASATVIAMSAALGINSASADVTYTSYTFTGINVQITGPTSVSGGAGQIQLHLSNGSTLLAWCIDVFDVLQKSGGTYSVKPSGPINNVSPSVASHIGGLMAEGNALVAAGKTLTLQEKDDGGGSGNGGKGNSGKGNGGGDDKFTFSVADEAAATQIAIWSSEYGSSFHYDTSKMPNGFSDLVQYIQQHAGNSTYYTLDPDPANCVNGQTGGCTRPGNQHLAYVPGPIVGAGLPGLLAACAALLAFVRGRRRVTA
jgi:hypothetical protein